MGRICPDRSRFNNVLIRIETGFDPGNVISVFLLAFGSKTSNFSFSGFLTVFLTEIQSPVSDLPVPILKMFTVQE